MSRFEIDRCGCLRFLVLAETTRRPPAQPSKPLRPYSSRHHPPSNGLMAHTGEVFVPRLRNSDPPGCPIIHIEWTDKHQARASGFVFALRRNGYDTFGSIAISCRIELGFRVKPQQPSRRPLNFRPVTQTSTGRLEVMIVLLKRLAR